METVPTSAPETSLTCVRTHEAAETGRYAVAQIREVLAALFALHLAPEGAEVGEQVLAAMRELERGFEQL